MAATRVSNRSVAAGVAASLGLLALPVPAAQAQTGAWEAHVDDSLILEARIGQYRLLGDIRGYFTDRGVCVSFEDLIQVLDLLVEIDEKSRRATGWLFSEERTLAIDRDADTVAISGNSAALRPGDIYDTPEGWCVDIGALSDWTGLTFSLDRVNLLLDIKSETKLPFLEAMERKNRAARLSAARPVFDIADLPQAELPYRAWRTPAVDILARLRYEQRGGSERRETRYELYASGEIASASVDARLASDNGGVPQSLRMRAYRFDPDGGLLGPLDATQIAVGDVETRSGALAGKKVLVTAGPTREPIDPVRYLTNGSTGTMGYALAAAAAARGGEVVLVSGPTNLETPEGVERIDIGSAEELHAAAQRHADADLVLAAAAVADYTPAAPSEQKVKKSDDDLTIRLRRTPDVLAGLGARKRDGQVLVGFALETHDGLTHARAKLDRKNLDWIVLNHANEAGSGFGTGTNRVTLVGRDGTVEDLPQLPKADVAEAILDRVVAAFRSAEAEAVR